ncbi:MAG: DMT family transporter [Pseudomonadota bacterium]
MNGLSWRPPAALALTLFIWAAFLVVTRAAMTTPLGVIEIGLLRYGTGAILFLPVLLRHGIAPRGARPLDLILIPLFGGVLFVALLASGLRLAPVADSGVFTPAMLPLYVALLSFLLMGERFGPLRLTGFALIVAGALFVGGWEALTRTDGAWRGHLMFTGASISWAIYTVVFRRSGLSPALGGALMCFWSALLFAAFAMVWGTNFTSVPAPTLLIQVIFQGLLSGFVATFTFFYAVQTIGASRTAAFAALVPVMAALGGWAFLDEPIGAAKTVGILVVAVGVALASGALRPGVGQKPAHHG